MITTTAASQLQTQASVSIDSDSLHEVKIVSIIMLE